MTRQTYERAPRLTKLATAHISKGDVLLPTFSQAVNDVTGWDKTVLYPLVLG